MTVSVLADASVGTARSIVAAGDHHVIAGRWQVRIVAGRDATIEFQQVEAGADSGLVTRPSFVFDVGRGDEIAVLQEMNGWAGAITSRVAVE
jgi:hypothetical protein